MSAANRGRPPAGPKEHPEIVAAERELGLRGGIVDLIHMAWPLANPGPTFIPNWHIDCIAEHLEAVSAGQIKRLLINIPPGCMKSLLCSVFWPIWDWIRDPTQKFIYGSYDLRLQKGFGDKTLHILQSDWFQARWGDRIFVPPGAAATDFNLLAGGFRFSCTPGGPVTGRHANKICFDDPNKPQDLTKNALEITDHWWNSTMASRTFNPDDLAKVGIMQRLHEGDLSAICERQGYVCVRLPMHYNKAKPCYTPLGGDPRTTDGQLLWPSHIDEGAYHKLTKDMPERTRQAQYEQNPVPPGGNIFLRDWFKTYPAAVPPGALVATPVIPANSVLVQSWDCTFKDTDGSDNVCGQVWAQNGACFYLVDQFLGRIGFAQTLEQIKAMRRKWPEARTILIEDKANGSAVIEMLRKEIPGIEEVNPNGGKVARANAVSPFFRAGNVFHPDPQAPGFAWVDAHRDELATFPFAIHDDQVDACSQALSWLYEKSSNLGAAMAKLRETVGNDPDKLAAMLGGFN